MYRTPPLYNFVMIFDRIITVDAMWKKRFDKHISICDIYMFKNIKYLSANDV